MVGNNRLRAGIFVAIFALIICFFGFKLYDLQVVDSEKRKDNVKTFTTVTRVKAARGDILDCNGNVVLMWSENGFPQSATYDADGVLAEYMSIYADEKCYRIIGYYPMGQTGTEGEPYLTCVLNVSETGETLIYRSTTGWASEKDPEATDVQPPEWFDAAWLEAPQTYPN